MAKDKEGSTRCAAGGDCCKKEKTIPPIKKAKVSSSEENLLAIVSPDSQKEMTSEQIVFCGNPKELKDYIVREEVQLVVWRRSQVPDFVRQLSDPNKSSLSSLPYFYGKVTPDTVVELMEKKLAKQEGVPPDIVREVIEDVAQLVGVFDSVGRTTLSGVHVRLEALADDGCRFWHQDTVPFRLVATYRGPCTEYVHPKFSQETLMNRQDDSKHAQSLTHYDVALFKGRQFHESPKEGEEKEEDTDSVNSNDDIVPLTDSGIVHRSPRIDGKGVVRLVLVLDIPADFHVNSSDEEDEGSSDEDESFSDEEEEKKS